MRRYLRLALMSFFASLSLLGRPLAAAEHTLAVLGIESVDGPDAAAQVLTDALRQRASATNGLKVVPGKDLVEMKMVFGCDETSAACMAQVGKSLGSEKLILGTVRKNKAGAFVIMLRAIDVGKGVVIREMTEVVSKRDLANNAPSLAAKWLAQLIDIEVKPVLDIRSDTPGATIEVDGQPQGTTPVTLRDIAPGTHSIVIAQAGREPFRRTIDLRPGGTYEINAVLERGAGGMPVPVKPVTPTPTPVPTPTPPPPGVIAPAPAPVVNSTPPPSGHPGRTPKYLALGAAIGAVIAGGVAIFTWRSYVGLEDTAHKDLEMVRSGLGAPATQVQSDFFRTPGCTVPDGLFSGAAADQYKKDCSSGQTYANATTGLWVVAGLLAATGIALYVVGDRQATKAAEKKKGSAVQQSLRFEPVFSGKSGGLSASFEF